MIVSDCAGSGRSGARVHTVHRHDIEAAGQFHRPAFSKGAQDIQGNFFGAVDEFIRHTHAVFNLDRHDGLGADLAAAGALRATFSDDVNVVVHVIGEILFAVERNRFRSAHGSQGAVAFDLIQETRNQLSREKRSAGNRVRSVGKTHFSYLLFF